MGKVMRVYLCGQDWTNSHEEMYLDLPAAPWELVDAMEKLNLTEEADLYVQAEEYYDFDYIQGFIPESTSLSQLNELCAALNSMDDMDRIGFRGLLQSSAFFDRFSLGIDKLMDIAQAKGCYHIAEDISNDTQLGRFLCFNGFVDGVGELPEKIYELLNFEKIGKDYRMAEHGAFADGCYVAPDGEIPHREMHYEICPPEYVVMLDVVNKADMNSHWPLALPAVQEEMDSTLRHIDAASWDEAVCICTDCQIPQLMETVTQTGNIATINRFAGILEGVPAEDITKLKAVLEVMHCDDLITASLIAGELDNYMLSENIRNPEDMGRWQLDYMLAKEDQSLVLKHINLYAYGKEVLEQAESSAMSAYGLVDRRDNQPILTATQSSSQMTMQ